MYFVTCFEKITKLEEGFVPWKDIGATRTFGYFKNFEEADFIVKNNCYNLFQNIYYYAVIEKIEPGICDKIADRWFYKYIEENAAYIPINKPSELNLRISNFASIG